MSLAVDSCAVLSPVGTVQWNEAYTVEADATVTNYGTQPVSGYIELVYAGQVVKTYDITNLAAGDSVTANVASALPSPNADPNITAGGDYEVKVQPVTTDPARYRGKGQTAQRRTATAGYR